MTISVIATVSFGKVPVGKIDHENLRISIKENSHGITETFD